MADRAFMLVPAQGLVGQFLKTFEEFPPRQRPASFSIDQALEKAREAQKTMAAAAPEHSEDEAAAPAGQGAVP
jgi:arylsulfatase